MEETEPTLVALGGGSLFAGDFRILQPINSGGMGAVYLVDQISTGKQRALKVMLPQLVANPDLRRRFEQEAQVGAKIDSEHIVEVQAAGVDASTGMPWISMELLRGEDLATRMTEGPIPPAEVRAIFEQLCHALGAAHAAGVVHRDLKPENIFLATSRRAGASLLVKVLDFGIAKLNAEAGTSSTASMGSPLWMAPEQTTRAPITPAADVWSLALIAYHLLTGAHFWVSARGTLAQVLREIVLEPIPPLSKRAAECGVTALVPAGFEAWFARCIDREPTKRFPDASAAWAALGPLLGGTTVGTAFATPAPRAATVVEHPALLVSSPPPRARRSLDARLVAVAAASFVVALAVLFIIRAARHRDVEVDRAAAFTASALTASAPPETVPIAAVTASTASSATTIPKPHASRAATSGEGRLPQEVINRIVRQNNGRFRQCYDKGLSSDPKLSGRVVVRFVIGRAGTVVSASDNGSDMRDPEVIACVVKAFGGVTFPEPEGGIVTVTYPLTFNPKAEQ